ncbi:MAG: hydroxymethylbilane synthase [Clostridium argentinense]|uniref:Porphobilinogen deaminase n=1 Tax=Clostridium faecium TaxID=2762223 RepID=A0ABR8YSU9_9CLOT|nr:MULTISPECIES: hydroxymethylbilane synthase [Clostridium]MBD8047338.1 hydroxymethylbilane synthase [Clostridium faecium]MBS5823910.1 hydroxymethylbilane synthase [Clostridium argentinense]MDU1350282.1 hydroxymethylbilane synthase [Clostridium argentinense]
MKVRIATRKSKLALVQTEFVMELIDKTHNIKCEKVLTDTLGDKRLDVTLDKIGGKGLFIKELEQLILDGHADAGVHSVKDMPYELPEGFIVAAMPVREDVRDAFVSMNGAKFKDLKKGARVGTSSRRRASQLKVLRPDIEIVPIRGNVQTRIDKIRTENLDGIILAAAGLKRLGMEEIITDYFEPHEMIPAIGQGALGIEIHESCKNKKVFTALDNYEVRVCVEAERSFMAALKGDCHSTIGAYATLKDDTITMIGIYEVDGKLVRKEVTGSVKENIKLGEELASLILNS